jgi:hypothetical protein
MHVNGSITVPHTVTVPQLSFSLFLKKKPPGSLLVELNHHINVSILAVTATNVSKLSNNQRASSSGVQQSNI